MYLICHTSIRAHHSNSKISCLTIEYCNGSLNCKDVPNSPKKSMVAQSDFIELKKSVNNSQEQQQQFKNHTKHLCVMNFT